jgi:transcriptional regulator with XRE-family HTH domain
MPNDSHKKDFIYDQMRKKIAERIKSVRRSRGYVSYEKFAHEHDISRSQINRYENLKGDMYVESLLKVIHALGMTPAEFFSEFDSW